MTGLATRGLERSYLRAVTWLNRKAKSAAVRLTHLTGKSKVPMHPKHLVPAGENQAWYLAHAHHRLALDQA